MKKHLLGWLLGVSVIVFAASASAMMMEGMKETGSQEKAEVRSMAPCEMNMPDHVFRAIDRLDLTDEQEQEIQLIRFVFAKDMVRKKADIDVASIELHEILVMDAVDMKIAEQKIRQVASLRGDLEIMNLKLREQIKAKLTPEQLEQLQKYMPYKRMRHDRMGRRPMIHGKRPVDQKPVKAAVGADVSAIEKAVKADAGAPAKAVEVDAGAGEKAVKADAAAVEKAVKVEAGAPAKAVEADAGAAEKAVKADAAAVEKAVKKVEAGAEK
ncbi:MAG: hypothetical protein WC202_13160 [Desulfobacterales bacterium]